MTYWIPKILGSLAGVEFAMALILPSGWTKIVFTMLGVLTGLVAVFALDIQFEPVGYENISSCPYCGGEFPNDIYIHPDPKTRGKRAGAL